MSSEQPDSDPIEDIDFLPEENGSLREMLTHNRGCQIAAILIALGIVTALIIAFVLLRRDDATTIDGTPTGGITTVGATPTPFSDAGGNVSVPDTESLVVGISDTDTISVTLDVPQTLQLGTRSLAIQSQKISADRVWSPSFAGDNTAVWIYGTIINYILGLSPTEENQALLERMEPGDPMVLTTRNGVTHTFSFESREQVPVGNPEIFAQQKPGLTLILVGAEGGERLVVNGRYVVDESSNANQGQGNVVELGETAQLDEMQITVTGAAYLQDRAEAQPGFAFYLVDYQIQNTGLTALDTSQLQLILTDELGNSYAVSPAAGQLGNHPALGGFLNASQTAEATAGYQVPIGLNSANVVWDVTNQVTGAQLQVTIPFGGGPQAAQNAEVTMAEAAVSPDLSSLILSGKVANLGEQPVVISEADISLQTDDGSVYLMLSTNPAFPWTVPPGQTVQFMVTFQRPIAADSAVFTVLNQPFQLSNLR